MKKILVSVSVIVVALLLTGCEAKTTVSQEEIPVPPAADDTGLDTPPVTGESDPAPATSSLTASIDTASIDTVFNQNFALAQEDAKTILGDEARFCFAKVSFLGGVVSTKGEMNYFFTGDNKIADYYWLVSFDSTQDNQKKRYLAAKRDWGNPTCTTLLAPPSFANAYTSLAAGGTIDTSTALTSARLNMTLTQDVWTMELFNTDGALILSETAATQPAVATSPTE